MDKKRWAVWRVMRQVSSKYRWYILGLMGISVWWAADHSIYSYLIRWLVDGMQGCTPGAGVQHLILPALLYLASGYVMSGLFRVWDYLTLRMRPALESDIMLYLAEYVSGHSHQFYQEQLAGALVNKMNDIAKGIPDLIEIFIEKFLQATSMVLIALGMLVFVMPKIAIVLALWTIAFLGVSLWFAPQVHALSDRVAEERSRITGYTTDVASNMLAVRLFVGSAHEQGLLKKMVGGWVHAVRQRDWKLLKVNLILIVLWQIREAILLWWIITGFQAGVVTAGDAALIITISFQLTVTLWGIGQDVTKFMKILGAVSQGVRTVFRPHTMSDEFRDQSLVVSQGKIEFNQVNFSYDRGFPLFSDLSIAIEPGQKVGLVGYSGSGKSTFVNIILRLFDIQKGIVSIDGQNIAQVSQESLRASIVLIPQDPSLFHRSLADNIRYGNFEATDEEVVEASRRAHADDFIQALPEGYRGLVGDRGVKLSGGQRQRIAIARAFLKSSKILILDEATSALDSTTERYIQESLEELSVGRTTLVIAHRLATLLTMDRILVFDSGKIVEDGSHLSLIDKKGRYWELWNSQINGVIPDLGDASEEPGIEG